MKNGTSVRLIRRLPPFSSNPTTLSSRYHKTNQSCKSFRNHLQLHLNTKTRSVHQDEGKNSSSTVSSYGHPFKGRKAAVSQRLLTRISNGSSSSTSILLTMPSRNHHRQKNSLRHPLRSKRYRRGNILQGQSESRLLVSSNMSKRRNQGILPFSTRRSTVRIKVRVSQVGPILLTLQRLPHTAIAVVHHPCKTS